MHLELDISASQDCEEIVLEVYVDQEKIFHTTASTSMQTITHDVDESAADHQLKLVMKGKEARHSVIDSTGQMVQDVSFKIHRLEFDEVNLYENFCQGRRSIHRHNFNSITQPEFDDEFYGEIGCNGTVFMPFATPFYLWLADNLW